MAQSGYDKVSAVIGEEMNKAWKNILERLAQASLTVLSGGPVITQTDLSDFFERLGGAHMGITFSCVESKGELSRYYAHELTPTNAIGTMGIEGSISIGVTIRF